MPRTHASQYEQREDCYQLVHDGPLDEVIVSELCVCVDPGVDEEVPSCCLCWLCCVVRRDEVRDQIAAVPWYQNVVW